MGSAARPEITLDRGYDNGASRPDGARVQTSLETACIYLQTVANRYPVAYRFGYEF